METKTIQLHKGLGSGRVELKEITNVEIGYTIRVCNPEGIETQRFVVGDPQGEEEIKKQQPQESQEADELNEHFGVTE